MGDDIFDTSVDVPSVFQVELDVIKAHGTPSNSHHVSTTAGLTFKTGPLAAPLVEFDNAGTYKAVYFSYECKLVYDVVLLYLSHVT